MEYTPQKAIADIDEVLNSTLNYDDTLDYQLTTDDCNWLEATRSVLEKQIPLEPDLISDGWSNTGYLDLLYDTWICPYCQTEYELDYDKYEYCPNCGQRIDWSDIK